MEQKLKCKSQNYKTLFKKYFSYLFLEKGSEGEREGEKHQCDRETLISCLSYEPQLGTEPATQACVLTRIEPVTCPFVG